MYRKIRDFVVEHFEGFLLLLVFLGVLAIAFLVHYKFSFLNFFFLPVILSGAFLGQRRAVLTAVFCVLVVVLYLITMEMVSGPHGYFIFDEVINLISWGSFLILTGALIGYFSEQRESKLEKLGDAYVGVLEIMLKYLESADETSPPSIRSAQLAGKVAAAAGLERHAVENIKSAALLSQAGELSTSLPLFVEMTDFLSQESSAHQQDLGDREKVLLKSTSSLLKEVEPLLNAFLLHYVEEADRLDKDLQQISLGVSIIALAQVYDKIAHQLPPFQGVEEFGSVENLQKLSGKTFHPEAVQALLLAVST
jgi:hypothetical protein